MSDVNEGRPLHRVCVREGEREGGRERESARDRERAIERGMEGDREVGLNEENHI